jgi:trans-aconitate 2-methyltransferase
LQYEFDGEAYKKASNHQKEWGKKIISEFRFSGNEHILDLGCGDGVLTAQLAELVPHGFVLGIDSSRDMIAVAQKLRKPNLAFKLQDINTLNNDEKFEIVFSNATLHWVKDHSCLLKNIFHCLRKNGVIRFNFAAKGNCSHFVKVVKSAMSLPDYSSHFKSFEWPWYMPTLREYDSLARRSQFTDVRVWGEIADRYFPDKETMIKWIDQPSIIPFLECIPAQKKKRFRDYVVEEMIKETIRAEGQCFETFRRINVYGRKQ